MGMRGAPQGRIRNTMEVVVADMEMGFLEEAIRDVKHRVGAL